MDAGSIPATSTIGSPHARQRDGPLPTGAGRLRFNAGMPPAAHDQDPQVPDDAMSAGRHPATEPSVVDDERIGERDLGEWRSATGRRLADLVLHGVGAVDALARWSLANLVLVVTSVVGGGVILLLDLAAAEVYESVAENDGLAGLDQPVLDRAVALRSPGLDAVVTGFTDLGGKVAMPVIAAVLTLLLALLWRRWTPVVVMAIAAAGSLAMTAAGKDLVGRARPPLSLAVPPYEQSPSFPSGHTLNTTVILGVAAYLLLIRWHRRGARVGTLVVAGGLVLAMGLSRVFLGHHWMTDVLAGWLLGLGWVVTVVTAHRLFLTVRRARPTAAGRSPSS